MKALIVLAVTLTYTACVRPGDHAINSACIWVEDDNRPLNVEKLSNRRHLRYDAITAEDLAIRWADQRFHLLPEYASRRDQCMEKLFNGVASQHGVDAALVREYRLKRDVPVDSAVIISFAFAYGLVAYYIAGRIRRRFPQKEPGFLIMTLTMALGVALVGLLVGILWSIVMEGVVLNSGHLSYRMNRIPMREHWAIALGSSVVLFGFVAAIQCRRSSPGTRSETEVSNPFADLLRSDIKLARHNCRDL